ncbi:uncharacterized protein DS421_18g617870 [Arachis hypogaea]|nr:uncharacterized protein DS421_18g617870 [Arachis hypogaea]
MLRFFFKAILKKYGNDLFSQYVSITRGNYIWSIIFIGMLDDFFFLFLFVLNCDNKLLLYVL